MRKQEKPTLIFLYKRKYPTIESKIDELSSRFNCLNLSVTPSRAFAFSICKVPALVVIDRKCRIRNTYTGLESILNFLELIREET